MTSIAVVTDTDASLPPALAERYGIRLVPINVHFGDEAFQTGVDIDDAALVERIRREGTMPMTSAPTPGQFAAAYEAAFDAGAEALVCFCVSSEISGTHNAAVQARQLFEGRSITVVDSRTVSMGQGYMALEAAIRARDGASVEEVIAAAEDVRERTSLYAALDTLRYLAMSGRVGHLAAGMASLLNIKPVLTLQGGKLDMLEKVRTRRKAWGRLLALTEASIGDRSVEKMAIVHVDAEDEARAFEEELRAEIACPQEITMAPFTAGLAVHTGPGMIGAVAVADG
ncbi:MAG: DegV family protein [Anaerolineae bacterium]